MKHQELAAGRVQSWGVQIIDLPSGAAVGCAAAYRRYRERRRQRTETVAPLVPLLHLHPPDLAPQLVGKLGAPRHLFAQICAQGPCLSLHEILCDYRDWLCRRALVDECEDLE